MNKDRRQGFAAGLLTAALALGLGGAALAAGRTIQVEDGVSVTLNGVPFTPKNAGGEEVPIFAYDGTIYAPVRAFSKAAGLGVDYDPDSRTARIETPDYAAAADPAAASYITAERARELALADAGVASADALFLKSYLDWEDGRAVYDVEFCAGTWEYDYELDALTGAVLKREHDLDDFDWSHHDGYRIHHSEPYGEGHHGGHHGLAAGDCISAASAQAKALEKLPGGRVTKCELDYDDDWCRWEYELELRLGNAEYDCELDAVTGEILKWELD